MAGDALSVLDGHQAAAAHIAGASLGGAIGQYLAVHHPDRVRSLTAIMTYPMGYEAGAALAALIPGARFQEVPGMGHGFFSPGIPAQIARLILNHTTLQP